MDRLTGVMHPNSQCSAQRAQNRMNQRKNITLRIERIMEEQTKSKKKLSDLDIPHL
jgi:hypothetical protein